MNIYVAYGRPNGWTDRAEFFCGHSWVAKGCHRLKKSKFYFSTFFLNLYFYGQRRAQGNNARKVISEVYAFFVLQCTVFGRKSKHKDGCHSLPWNVNPEKGLNLQSGSKREDQKTDVGSDKKIQRSELTFTALLKFCLKNFFN